ncbi:BrnA antitoxin family protein [Oligoflexia bacterium]|nr:BrnA antitoxin family protein [Oligoflexia bacterium]
MVNRKKTGAKRKSTKKMTEIRDYDEFETTEMIDSSKSLRFKDLGLKLPDTPPTQVVSIRLPSDLLNEIKALGSQRDVPYQALIKLFLSESLENIKDKKVA